MMMKFSVVATLVVASMAMCQVSAMPVSTMEGAMAYLRQFGYLQSEDMDGAMPRTDEIMRKAIENFQVFANITMSGGMSNRTFDMMNTRRCGMPDMDGTGREMTRKKRYALGGRWSRTALSYRIDSYYNGLENTLVDTVMERALQLWSENSGLTFQKRSSSQSADIIIDFFSGDHRDGDPFDGPGGVLAHAYLPGNQPINGDAHFDSTETFTDGTSQGTNLLWVAAHEFGHSLGLGHSQENGALMFPYYTGYNPNFKLPDDDQKGIQALYGENAGQPDVKPTVPITPIENCMDSTISLAFSTGDGTYYLGNATHVFRTSANPVEGPIQIGDEFPGLPDNLDAGFYYDSYYYGAKTYIFKGSQFWRLTNRQIDAGYPQDITTSDEFGGLPGDLDAAFVWSYNGRIYFTKGDQYYRVTLGWGVDRRYPRPLSIWNGLPSKVDAAFQYANYRTYFFQGTNYYRFHDYNFEVEDSYPRNTAVWWLDCDPLALGLAPDNGAGVLVLSKAHALLSLVLAVASAFRMI